MKNRKGKRQKQNTCPRGVFVQRTPPRGPPGRSEFGRGDHSAGIRILDADSRESFFGENS